MRFPDEILKCVVFLGRYSRTGTEPTFVLTGTAFLVRMASEKKGQYFTYLVAAKHSADRLTGCKWGVRLNKKGGGCMIVEGTDDVRWARHPVEPDAVDAAVVPWAPPMDADVGYLPDTWFATNEVIADNKIGCGDEVSITGLFSKLSGKERNHPIVRTGNIAMLPEEPIQDIKIGDYRGPATVYLIEARSLGGLSGSPVFVRQSVMLQTQIPERLAGGDLTGEKVAFYAQARVFLLGSMHGHWEVRPSEQNDMPIHTASDRGSVAIGIAVVVPAFKILEILNQESFRRGREQINSRLRDLESS
jgi:hypothetical protein